MRLIKRLIGLCLGLVILAGAFGAFLVFGEKCSANLPGPLSSIRTNLINSVADVTGIKANVEAALRESAVTISQRTGIPVSTLNSAIDSLDIPSWKVCDLPENAVETGHYNLVYKSIPLTLVTYDTTEYVSIEAYGQTFTMTVPDSARTYIAFLGYFR